jgi:hypothetical protein
MRNLPIEAADVRDYVEALWDRLSGEHLWTLNHLSVTDDFGSLADIESFMADYPRRPRSARAVAKAYIAQALATPGVVAGLDD